jgi:hypothetical protein
MAREDIFSGILFEQLPSDAAQQSLLIFTSSPLA